MKNLLKYYYNLKIKEVIKKKEYYQIICNDSIYYYIPFSDDINLLTYIYSNIVGRNIYIHKIILNKDNSIVTFSYGKSYILLKDEIRLKPINFLDILNFSVFIKNGICNWDILWSDKLDYYEYHINQNRIKYRCLYDSFYYYSGLCECAIEILNFINRNNIPLYINHKRIKKNISTISFYNPLNLVLDVRVRDVCEYFKEQFFYSDNPINKVKRYLNFSHLSNDEAVLFFSRILYPSYYFDVYDEIVKDNYSFNKLQLIIEKNKDFECFIRDVYYYMRNIYDIPEIEWIIKT